MGDRIRKHLVAEKVIREYWGVRHKRDGKVRLPITIGFDDYDYENAQVLAQRMSISFKDLVKVALRSFLVARGYGD